MNITIKETLNKLLQRQNLSADEMTHIMQCILQGEVSDIQLSAFLLAMRMKGETVTELVAACEVLRQFVTPVTVTDPYLLDIVGTGGDQTHTFNVSTASSFVVAAAGGKVAKHGNRSVSSHSGSADVLAAAGISLTLNPQQIAECINKLGIGFMFAPQHHPAMKHAAAVRKELGVRTFFNLLGPLNNPAHVKKLLIGVYESEWVVPIAEVLKQLGCEHVLVVHGEDGLDEISIGAETQIAELKNDKINSYTLAPEQFGFTRSAITTLKVTNAAESLLKLQQVLRNEPGSARDIVTLNAGAAIYVAGLAADLTQGVNTARQVLASGAAYEKFMALIKLSQQLVKT